MYRKVTSKTHLQRLASIIVLAFLYIPLVHAGTHLPVVQDGILEWTIGSSKIYHDPFNDVDVDVIFTKEGSSWRVPTFWRGGSRWTVRFAPPNPGEYKYRLDSSDKSNPDLNNHVGRITVDAYGGPNTLFRRGMPRISANGRYFEQADGTPFYWLADTWWMGLSGRLPWEGFQRLTLDRAAKGFTVVQLVMGLVPYEETPPSDPGFCNEGGCVWDAAFTRINPGYFESADRRIRYLLDQGITPAIVGGWRGVLREMGVAKMKRHWRYLIARYGAYPVFWIVGGEIVNPPDEVAKRMPIKWQKLMITRGWTEVARYVKATDPYHHPLTAHEWLSPFDIPFKDPLITDFDLIQSNHMGAASLAMSVAQIDLRRARIKVIKPIVQGEIGYENFLNRHFENFQRAAFWLSMLNGAAGHTYGADGTFEAYSEAAPLHRMRYSFRSWEEGMKLPGSYQVGLGANLLRQYRWWLFEPHPEWVSPRGTTLLEPRDTLDGTELGTWLKEDPDDYDATTDFNYPLGEWKARNGTVRYPYASGIPGEVRFIYIPYGEGQPLVVLNLEPGVHYQAYYWQPAFGIKFDLGAVAVSGSRTTDQVNIGNLKRRLQDASGVSRGNFQGSVWDTFGSHQRIEGTSYHPEKPPTPGDWVLVLDAQRPR